MRANAHRVENDAHHLVAFEPTLNGCTDVLQQRAMDWLPPVAPAAPPAPAPFARSAAAAASTGAGDGVGIGDGIALLAGATATRVGAARQPDAERTVARAGVLSAVAAAPAVLRERIRELPLALRFITVWLHSYNVL